MTQREPTLPLPWPNALFKQRRWRSPESPKAAGGWLIYPYPSVRAPGSSDATPLDDFVTLAEAPDEAIESFAKRWGVLELCPHGKPQSHWFADRPQEWPCVPSHDQATGLYREPLERWRWLSADADAILTIAKALRLSRPPPVRLWRLLDGIEDAVVAVYTADRGQFPIAFPYRLDELVGLTHLDRDLAFGRRVLGVVADGWIRDSAARVRLDWSGDRPRLRLEPWGLFGALAIELAQHVSKIQQFSVCPNPNCGKVFEPTKRGQHYCSRECSHQGTLASWRQASKKQREAKRAPRQGGSGERVMPKLMP